MPTRKARSPVAAFRKLLLAALVLVVAGGARPVLFRQAGEAPPGGTAPRQGGAPTDSPPGGGPAGAINAQRLIYDRQQHWLRAEGGASILRGADRLAAGRIYGNLSDDETVLTFVHAFWDIEGETH